MATKNIIELSNLTKVYQKGGAGEVKAVDDVFLEVAESEFLTILGPSGSGKTTLLNLIGGLDRPTGGTVILDGQELSKLSEGKLVRVRREKIGFVFQSYNLLPRTTALRNVEIPMMYGEVGKEEREKRAKKYLEMVGLGDRLEHTSNQLSGGQQQRVAIARALAMRPKVMLLDEVTSALDPEVIGEVTNVIRKLNDEHDLTILMVTHQMGFAREISDRICFFDEGVIAEQGTPDDLFDNPQNQRTKDFLSAVKSAD